MSYTLDSINKINACIEDMQNELTSQGIKRDIVILHHLLESFPQLDYFKIDVHYTNNEASFYITQWICDRSTKEKMLNILHLCKDLDESVIFTSLSGISFTRENLEEVLKKHIPEPYYIQYEKIRLDDLIPTFSTNQKKVKL